MLDQDAEAEADRDPETPKPSPSTTPFDFDAFPLDSLFHDRRGSRERRGPAAGDRIPPTELPKLAPGERRAKKERRRRIDPTTFEKQYTDDEMEFMNAMQRFKVQTGKAFPSYGEVLQVAYSLGYRGPADLQNETASDVPSIFPANCGDSLIGPI